MLVEAEVDVEEVATEEALVVVMVEVTEMQAACALAARSKERRMLGVCILLSVYFLVECAYKDSNLYIVTGSRMIYKDE